jgi:anhydro-N-acetylmuramic acid kinase
MRQLSNGKDRFDPGGRHAVQGRLIPELLHRWLHHPFFLRRPPKSLHRSIFAEEFARQIVAQAQQAGWGSHDLLCTANHLVARVVGESIRRVLPREGLCSRVILTGGGVRNGLLRRLLEEYIPPGTPQEPSDTSGLPAEAMDAAVAALLACYLFDSHPANVPLATGASGQRLLGSLTPGSAANWSRCLQWMTNHELTTPEED